MVLGETAWAGAEPAAYVLALAPTAWSFRLAAISQLRGNREFGTAARIRLVESIAVIGVPIGGALALGAFDARVTFSVFYLLAVGLGSLLWLDAERKRKSLLAEGQTVADA